MLFIQQGDKGHQSFFNMAGTIPPVLSSSWERLEESSVEGWKPVRKLLLPSRRLCVPRAKTERMGGEKKRQTRDPRCCRKVGD